MRVVDEIPQHQRHRYDYAEIDRLIDQGKIVALDADEYRVANANSIKTNLKRYADRNHKSWRVTVRGRTAYVEQGSAYFGATGVVGR